MNYNKFYTESLSSLYEQGVKVFDATPKVAQTIAKNTPDIKLTKMLNNLDSNLETLTGSRLGDSQGEFLDKRMLEDLHLNSMPKEVKEALPEPEEWLANQFFNAYAFNESVLGTTDSKRALGLASGNMLINACNATTHAQCYLKPKNEYVNAVFDSALSINSPNSVWRNFSDNDLLEGLQADPNYKLVTLEYNKKYGLKTREIMPTTVEQVHKAREAGAIIMPLQTYKDMYNTVNHRLGSTGFSKLWSRFMYIYKFGYLCRPGAWVRNYIDTNIKSALELKDEYGAYKQKAYAITKEIKQLQSTLSEQEQYLLERAQREYGDLARRLYKNKDDIDKFIQRRSKDGYIREEAIKQYFAEHPNSMLTYDVYKELEDFFSSGISGNIMKDLYAGEGGNIWRTFTQITGNVIDVFNKTEEYNRLALYLYQLDHGANHTSALAKLAKIHFDYSFKTKAEQLIEMVFPFSTFSFRNFSYWVEMVEKHPWIMRNYVNLVSSSWDFKDYTPEELATNYRAQTQIIYGQLKLGEFNKKRILFKANPSIQDAIQMFSDPINNVYEKLVAPLAVPINKARGEYTDELSLIPILGPMLQSLRTMKNTGTPMPSLIGVQKPYKNYRKNYQPYTRKNVYKNNNFAKINDFRDGTYRTPYYRNNVIYDAYATKGVNRYRVNLYPVVDIAHDIKMRYSTDVYNRVKYRVRKDVFKGVQYQLRLDANRFR